MRLIQLILILAVSVSLMSCIKRIPKKDASNANTIESLDGPRVVRETTPAPVVDETPEINVEPARDIVAEQPAPVKTTSYSSSNTRSGEREDHVDRNNSGFFDQYQSGYNGDPNRNLQPITRVVDDGSDDINRKKEAIAKSLNVLEKRNQQQQQEYDLREKERQAANAKAIQQAKEDQKNQQQQQKPKAKTLDTNLLLNNK